MILPKTLEELRKIVEDNVNRSGYAVELHVRSILAKDFLVYANDYFLDHDKKEARSLDLVVRHVEFSWLSRKKPRMGPISITIPIECKKSENNAWVFFVVKDLVVVEELGQIIDYRQVLSRDFQKSCVLWEYEKPRLHYGRSFVDSEVAVSYSVVRKGKMESQDNISHSPKDDIFEAINQVLKYIVYDISRQIATYDGIEEVEEDDDFIDFYFPVIVFDGDLYRGRLVNGRIRLEETNHLVLKYNYRSPHSEEAQDFLIDIVKKEHFETFFKEILYEECGSLCKLAKRNRKKLFGDAQKALDYSRRYSKEKP